MFFDFIHEFFMKLKWYRVVIGRLLKRLQRKEKHVENRMDRWGYFALMFFVPFLCLETVLGS